MTILIIGLVLFFAAHSISIVNRGWRDGVAEAIGELPWKGLYTLVALPGFVLIVWGYGLARQDPTFLYSTPSWLHYVALVLMVPVFPLFMAAYLPGRIKTAVGHPMVTATMLWAVAHLLTNGMLADVALFGAFLVWAIANRISCAYREQAPVSEGSPPGMNDGIVIGGGLIIYGLFVFWWHKAWFGVPALA